MIDKEIGFIKIERFSLETAREFRFASFNLKQKGMKKLVIDLRNNGGGILTGATDIADEFLKRMVKIAQAVTIGDPMAGETEMGPLCTYGQLENIEREVARAEAAAGGSSTNGATADSISCPYSA